MIKILKISSLPTSDNPKSGFHIIKTSNESNDFKFIYVKINKGKLLKKFQNLEYYDLGNNSSIFKIIKLLRLIFKINPNIISIHNYKFFLIPIVYKLISFNKKIFIV